MLPEGFAARMRALLGSEYGDFLASFDRPLCTGLRKNPLVAFDCSCLQNFPLLHCQQQILSGISLRLRVQPLR